MDKKKTIERDLNNPKNNTVASCSHDCTKNTGDYVYPNIPPFLAHEEIYQDKVYPIKSFKGETKPFVCPVCGGKGIVPNGFYNSLNNYWSTTSTTPEKCRTCDGTGVIWG